MISVSFRLSLSLTPQPPAASMRRHRLNTPKPPKTPLVRFVSGLFAELSMKDPCNYSRALQ